MKGRLVVRGQCDEALQPMPTHALLGTAEHDDCVVLGLASAIARLSCTLYPGAPFVVVVAVAVVGGGGVSPAAAVPPSETDILHTCGIAADELAGALQHGPRRRAQPGQSRGAANCH